MMRENIVPVKSLPFLRLLIALIIGIIIQWYFKVSMPFAIIITLISLLFLTVFNTLSFSKKFIFGWLQGLLILVLFFATGLIITSNQTITHNSKWYGNHYKEGDILLITIKEPIVEKTNSYKAVATINSIKNNTGWIPVKGDILLYFKKDSAALSLQYGSQIITARPLQNIQNSGNPAAFDYSRYCLFQNITGQLFLSDKDYQILPAQNKNMVQNFLFLVRDWALKTLRQNIHSPNELGIAEALLIGYRNDLDRDLVQAYSNTGVVHIIAISGLHIAMIYAGLLKFFTLFKSSRLKKWIEPVIILAIIWLFTLVAGAAPSVLRAAVMFTFLLAGKFIGKNANVYNTLAASAFVLLLINPFFLWDVGFQLSYAAVFGIILFFKIIRNLLYFKNKSLRWIWDLCAVSLSAQIFTTPLIIYYFHQLPLLFLVTNLFIVPLSGIVLIAELFLFTFSFLPVFATMIGKVTEVLIWLMNVFINYIDRYSFSVWNGLQISIIQVLLLYAITTFIAFWVFGKNTKNIIYALVGVLAFFILRNVDLLKHKKQQEIIVYNISKQKAIDIIAGNDCLFVGDSIVITQPALRNFHIKPAHITKRISAKEQLLLPDISNRILSINALKILLPDGRFIANGVAKKIKIDVLILSKTSNISPADINNMFDCKYIVTDSSVPSWKSSKWKKDFEQLHLRLYSVAQEGAFILKL